MNDREKSDSVVVPVKRPNKAGAAARDAEVVEERTLAKGNSCGADTRRTQRRGSVRSGLSRVREAPSRGGLSRYYPRQEPGAVVPHAGICAGGGPTPKC